MSLRHFEQFISHIKCYFLYMSIVINIFFHYKGISLKKKISSLFLHSGIFFNLMIIKYKPTVMWTKKFIRYLLSAFVKSLTVVCVTHCAPGAVPSPLPTLLHQILILLSPFYRWGIKRLVTRLAQDQVAGPGWSLPTSLISPTGSAPSALPVHVFCMCPTPLGCKLIPAEA